MKELLTALVAAKAAFRPIPKDKVNPFHKSKYASLDAVLGAIEPGLLANGLTLCHFVEDGKLITRLYHTSGDYLESKFNLPDLSDPQKLGSIISYYRRYAVCGLLSVTADEDDDGNAAGNGGNAAGNNGNAAKPAAIKQAPYVPPVKPPVKPTVNPDLEKIETQKQALREYMEILEYVNPDLEKIEIQKQALRECMEILEYDQNQKSDFAKTINPKPFSTWSLANWEMAVIKALSAIDQMNEASPVEVVA